MNLADALAIIDDAAHRAHDAQGIDEQTIAALRSLWHLGGSQQENLREAILWFKDTLTDSDNAIGRSQNANAARNRIRWLLGATR